MSIQKNHILSKFFKRIYQDNKFLEGTKTGEKYKNDGFPDTMYSKETISPTYIHASNNLLPQAYCINTFINAVHSPTWFKQERCKIYGIGRKTRKISSFRNDAYLDACNTYAHCAKKMLDWEIF